MALGIKKRKAAWTPSAISTATLFSWHTVKRVDTITIATGASQWNDLSKNANNGTQASGPSQPTYGASTVFLGYSTLKFNGSQFLNLPNTYATGLADGYSSFEMWAVWTVTSGIGFQQTPLGLGHTSNSNYIVQDNNNGQLVFEKNGVLFGAGAGSVSLNAKLLTRFVFATGTNNVKGYLQNNLVNATTQSNTPETLNRASIGLCPFNSGTIFPLRGEIAELITVQGNLNADESLLMQNYFLSQWGTFP